MKIKYKTKINIECLTPCPHGKTSKVGSQCCSDCEHMKNHDIKNKIVECEYSMEIIMKNPCKACNNNIKPHIWCDKKREYIKYLDGNTVLKDKSISVSSKAMPARKRGSK